jgi:hypothetical protein
MLVLYGEVGLAVTCSYLLSERGQLGRRRNRRLGYKSTALPRVQEGD